MSNVIHGAFAPVQPAALFPASSSQLTLESGRPYVYILPTIDRSRIKIGRSLDPLDRIAGLLNIYPEIDLTRAAIIAVDTLRIELVLHIVFGLRRQKRILRCDGYTEWFAGDFGDEVIGLCHRIADHRREHYQVIHDLDALLQAYRLSNPSAGLRTPRVSKAERLARLPLISLQLTELAIDHALSFTDVLGERPFDGVNCHRDRYSLVRTVQREDEPECWDGQTGAQVSAWSRRLLQAANVSIHIDGGRCIFHFVKPPSFERLNEQFGRESYRLTEGPPAINLQEIATSLPAPDKRAFQIVWDALAQMKHLNMPENGQPNGK